MKERVNTRAGDKENKCKREIDFNKDIQTETRSMRSCALTLKKQKTSLIIFLFQQNLSCFTLFVVVLLTGFNE